MSYVSVGDVPPKTAHVYHEPVGSRLAEELMGEQGFSGASSLLYHRRSPSAITGVEAVDVARSQITAEPAAAPLAPSAADRGTGGDLVTGASVLLGERSPSTLCGRGQQRAVPQCGGDELVYVQSGRARYRIGVRPSRWSPGTTSWCPRRRPTAGPSDRQAGTSRGWCSRPGATSASRRGT